MVGYYRPYNYPDLNYTEGKFYIILSTFRESYEINITLPNTSLTDCTSQTIKMGAGNPNLAILFKQLKLYKGSFLNNTQKIDPGCHIQIADNNFTVMNGDNGVFNRITAANTDCLLPNENYVYNEYNNTFNSSNNLTEFCNPGLTNNSINYTRLSLSGQEIQKCELCYASENGAIKCPEPGICKDGVVQISYEDCDDGQNDAVSKCSHYCDAPKMGYKCNVTINKTTHCDTICGDYIWITTNVECNDGNSINGDICEECDDGNLINGDGCDVNCQIEDGYICTENNANYSACERCPEGTNKTNQSFCSDCKIHNCAVCSKSLDICENCKTYPDFFFFIDNNTCNSTCPDSNYFLEAPGICTSCPSNCTKCLKNITDNEIKCFNCYEENFIFNDRCVSYCPDGYYFNGSSCLNCGFNCISCHNGNFCINCVINYFLGINGSCVSSCDAHQYNSNGVCQTCNSECLNCTTLNWNCSACSNGYIKNNTSGVCEACNSECLSCTNFKGNCSGCSTGYIINSSDSSQCILGSCPTHCICDLYISNCIQCDSDKYTLKNNKCQPICPNFGYFLNESIQECIKCSDNCLNCVNTSVCTQCISPYFLINQTCVKSCGYGKIEDQGVCINCSQKSGYDFQCNEICGDGILYLKDTIYCDDNNTIDGDGCSSKCLKEKDFACERPDEKTSDICYDLVSVQYTIQIFNNDAQNVYVSTNKKFNFPSTLNLANAFNVSISSLNVEDFSYNVTNTSIDTFYFKFQYKTSFKNVNLLIITKNSSNFYDFKTIYKSSSPEIVNLLIVLPFYNYISADLLSKIDTAAKTTETVALSATGISVGPLALIHALNIFWCLVDAMQIANFYLLININYPQNAEMFFNILAASNLKFLPNYFENIFNLNFTVKTKNGLPNDLDPVIKAPSRFNYLGMTSSFIKNAGGISGLMFLVFTIFILLSASVKIFEKRHSTNIIAVYITKFYRLIRYDLIMRLQLTIFLDLTLATLLQLRVCSAKEKTYLLGFILSVICLCYLFYFFYVVLKIVNDDRVLNKDKEYFEVYGTLYDGLNVERTIPRNYQPIMIIRKFIFCIFLVYFHDYPSVTVALISFIQILSAILLVKYKPFITKTQNFVAILSEIFLSIVMIMIIWITILQSKETNKIDSSMDLMKLNLGWALISFCLTVLVLYLLLFGYEQFVNYKKAKDILREVKKQAKDKFLQIKTKIMERTWSRDERNSKTNRDRPDSVASSKKDSFSPSEAGSSRISKFSKFKKEEL